MGNSEYDKVMRALRERKGDTQQQREEKARKREAAETQAKRFQARQARAEKLRKRKRGGGDDVIDSGMFSS